MSNLTLACVKKKDKRTCGVKQASLKKCVGCKWSRVGENVKADCELKVEPLKPYPHYIKCAKCKLTYEATHPNIRDSVCPECGHPLGYKPKFSTQYHLKPMELPYSCSAIKRSCDTHPPYGNDVQCVGCRYREPVGEPKHV